MRARHELRSEFNCLAQQTSCRERDSERRDVCESEARSIAIANVTAGEGIFAGARHGKQTYERGKRQLDYKVKLLLKTKKMKEPLMRLLSNVSMNHVGLVM